MFPSFCMTFPPAFDVTGEHVQLRAPQLSIARKPFLCLREATHVQLVDATLAVRFEAHELTVPQHLKVARDRRPADIELRIDFVDRTWTVRETLDDAPADGIAQLFEDLHGIGA